VWNEARLINATANLLMVLAVFALLVGAVVWLVRMPVFELKRIEIEPLTHTPFQYVSPELIRGAIAGQLEGNFFTMNLKDAREVFESAAWVRRASIRRVWPNILRVSIDEQQPWALWNENQMINTWGEAFTANRAVLDNESALPHFYGPEGTESLMVQRAAELDRWFEQLQLKVKTLTLTNRYALVAELSNGLTLDLGRDPGAEAPDPQAGVPGALPFGERIERFVRVWPLAMAQLNGREPEHVDLRYPNGFALTLAPLPESAQPKKKR
jgi:cell division protein FtsQ